MKGERRDIGVVRPEVGAFLKGFGVEHPDDLFLAGDGDHYAANVVSTAFKGKSRVQQHQMVYAALKGRMGGELHALALQTSTPED